MKLDITFKEIPKESHESSKKFLSQVVERHLEPHLRSFRPGRLNLHAVLEKRKNGYRVKLRLHVPPKKVLVSKAGNADLNNAISEAIKELAAQAERHNAQVSGREQWKRKARRKRLHELKAKRQELEMAQPDQQELMLASLLPKLESYVRHELTYLRNSGELLDDYPRIADVVDEAFLRLQTNPDELIGAPEQVYQRLLKHAIAVIQEEVEKTREQGSDISLEDKAPQDASDQAEEMVEEEINEFYQPDEEELHIADLIPDTHIETPEQQAEAEALDTSYYLLGSFPTLWRRVVILVYRERLLPEDVAKNVLEMELEAVQKILEYSEAFIQAHLQSRGLSPRQLENMLQQLEN